MTGAVGISVMPLENRRQTILHLATEAERCGYDAFYLPETWAHDTTVLLAEAAARTQRIGLGTGILGVWGRSPGTLAMAAATLQDVSGGRFALGLGASTKQLVEGLHDVPFSAPVERMRRVIAQVRALLRGERIPLAADTGARALRLNLPPAPDLPIYLAGLAAETIRLAGEVADGWMPFLFPRSRMPEGIALLREGAARAGAPARVPRIVPSMPTVVAADADEARKGAAWFVAFYLTTMGPFYPRIISRLGFEREVQAVIAANATRKSAVVPKEAEALLDELIVYGTPAEARARLARWQEAGAALSILLLPPNLEPAQIDFTLDALR
jgi:alkanesulfonate monooxygenase SsuD/methylene tetrahydromethanopterin reductase-like flavin-dependent oxidoreductase (luciferase family)